MVWFGLVCYNYDQIEIESLVIIKKWFGLVWRFNQLTVKDPIPLWRGLRTAEVYLKQPGPCYKRKLTIIIKVSLFVTIVKAGLATP